MSAIGKRIGGNGTPAYFSKLVLGAALVLAVGGCAQTETISDDQRALTKETTEVSAFVEEEDFEDVEIPTNENLTISASDSLTELRSVNESTVVPSEQN